MKENSIEEDIKTIENYLKNSAINETDSNFFRNGGWEIVDLEIPKVMQHILLNLKKILKENEKLKCYIAIANTLEERIKENFIPKEKIVDIIEKISVYKKLAKESIEQRIVIADSDSLEYGRMQAHNIDMSMLQELLKKIESEE